MIARLLMTAMLAASAATAQVSVTRAWFADGAEVQLHTETTGGTLQSRPGGGGIADEHLFRIIQDGRYDIVFAYELEATKVQGSGAVTIRIKPKAGSYPTVSAVREFPAVRIGQEVKLEILTNPATGEKVYDVIRPADEPSPDPGHPIVRVSALAATSGVKLVVNGKEQWLENLWTPGKPARLYLPGHGAYYLSWENRPKFRLAGYRQGNRLIFLLDSEYVELTFDDSVKLGSEGGPVWIYHDPAFLSRDTAELDVANLEGLHAK